MKQYHALVQRILDEGIDVSGDRSGVGTRLLPGISMKFDLTKGFPLITARKINIDKTMHELMWFIRGDENVEYLRQYKVPFWEKWTSPRTNTVGPMYPYIWRSLEVVSYRMMHDLHGLMYRQEVVTHIDQFKELIEGLAKDPYSRRYYLSNVNLGMRPDPSLSPIENIHHERMALDTCHREFFCIVTPLTLEQQAHIAKTRAAEEKDIPEDQRLPIPTMGLHTVLTMRSNDVMIGMPHNIAQYAALNHLLCALLNMAPLSHTHQAANAHIYSTHLKQAEEYLKRPYSEILPQFYISPYRHNTQSILKDGTFDYQLTDYHPQETMSFSLEG